MRSFAVLAATVGVAIAFEQMNGNYVYSDGVNPGQPGKHRGTGFFEIETDPYITQYAEVDWDVRTVDLDPKLVAQFKGKLINFVGYEFDLIRVFDNGTERSAHAWELYNHHYANSIIGTGAKLVKTGVPTDHKGPMGVDDDEIHTQPFAAGGYRIVPSDPNAQVGAPAPRWSNAGLIMGNGAESRKTFHFLPPGYGAQVYSPYQAVLHPMLIDTTNRQPETDPDTDPGHGRHGIVPKKSNVPPSAMYSGLMECPCTDKFPKVLSSYSTLESGTCNPAVNVEADCFLAGTELGLKPVIRNMSVSNDKYPAGCSAVATAGGFEIVFNNLTKSATTCGAPTKMTNMPRVAGMAESLVQIAVDLDPAKDLATITLTGPAMVWFGVGLGASGGHVDPADPSSGLTMAGTNWTIVVLPNGTVWERRLGNHFGGTLLPSTLTVLSNVVNGSDYSATRTVTMTRSIKGAPSDLFAFDPRAAVLPFINAIGASAEFTHHINKSTGTIYFVELDYPTCICDTAADQGTLGGNAWGPQKCVAAPLGQMLDDPNWRDITGGVNPTCSLKWYSGGLRCCKGGVVLLDSDQVVPQTLNSWKLKYRYYYEEGSEDPTQVVDTVESGWWTEHNNNENDVPLCKETNKSLCVSTITSNFTANMFGGCENGCEMIHMEGHCHIGCIRMEMWIMDDPANPKLLCRTEVDHGHSDGWMDESGYIAGAQPCIYGRPEDNFTAPTKLLPTTQMMSVKVQNNTYARYGDMGLWELRLAPTLSA